MTSPELGGLNKTPLKYTVHVYPRQRRLTFYFDGGTLPATFGFGYARRGAFVDSSGYRADFDLVDFDDMWQLVRSDEDFQVVFSRRRTGKWLAGLFGGASPGGTSVLDLDSLYEPDEE